MKFKSLAMLGILLVSLTGSGVVSRASEDTSRVYETDSSYDVSAWLRDDGTVETDFTYETAPWIADDGTVDNDLAHYFRIANAETGGTEVNEFYSIARHDVSVYKSKDRNSGVVGKFDLNDLIYIHLIYEDGWAWSGEVQGYIPLADLSEDFISVDKVDSYYCIAGDSIKIYEYKDTSSKSIEYKGRIFISELHSDGWAWSQELWSYIRQEDLTFKEKVFSKKSGGTSEDTFFDEETDISEDAPFSEVPDTSEDTTFDEDPSAFEGEGAVTIVTDGYEITISPKKN